MCAVIIMSAPFLIPDANGFVQEEQTFEQTPINVTPTDYQQVVQQTEQVYNPGMEQHNQVVQPQVQMQQQPVNYAQPVNTNAGAYNSDFNFEG